MPFLDVSEILTDPDFCQTITVQRSTQDVSKTGFAFNPTTTLFEVVAVVTIGSMQPMVRAAEGEVAKNVITVHSKVRLLSIIDGFQPDIVIWRGKKFVVKRQNDWSQYGEGYTAAECELQETTSEA